MIKNYVKNDKETVQVIIISKLKREKVHMYAVNN